MSYPFIGLADIGFDDYGPSTIEQMLREGKHIYEPDDEGVTYFDADLGKFILETLGTSDPIKGEKVKIKRSFDSYIDLASFVAFWGKEFL